MLFSSFRIESKTKGTEIHINSITNTKLNKNTLKIMETVPEKALSITNEN